MVAYSARCPICVRGLAIVSVSVSASVFPTVAESLKAFQYRHSPPLLPTPWVLSFPVMSRSGQAPWCVCKWRDHSSLKQPPPRTCSRKAGRRLGVCTAYPPHGFFPPKKKNIRTCISKLPPPSTCSRKAGRRLGVCTTYPPHGFFPPPKKNAPIL